MDFRRPYSGARDLANLGQPAPGADQAAGGNALSDVVTPSARCFTNLSSSHAGACEKNTSFSQAFALQSGSRRPGRQGPGPSWTASLRPDLRMGRLKARPLSLWCRLRPQPLLGGVAHCLGAVPDRWHYRAV